MLQGSSLSVFSVVGYKKQTELNGFFLLPRLSAISILPPDGLEPLVSDLHGVPHHVGDLKRKTEKLHKIAHYHANWEDYIVNRVHRGVS